MKGFNNIGNTCYLNAGLQLLIRNFDLCKIIIKYSNKSEILNKLSNIILEYYDDNTNTIDPYEIKKILENRQIIFNGFTQQDSTEFIILLLNIIDEEIKNCDPDSSELENIFGLNLNVIIKCKFIECLQIKDISEKNILLILDITDNCYTLDDCYRKFKSKNILDKDNQYFCEKCNTKRIASKRYQVINWPNYLLIYLKRFNQVGTRILKQSKSIEIPMIWRHNMHLTGAVIHYGSTSSGHYVYIGKDNNKWYLFNDNQVTEIFDNEINNKLNSAYYLIYKNIL